MLSISRMNIIIIIFAHYFIIQKHVTHTDTHSHSIASSKESTSVAVCLDESLSIENQKWITTPTSNRNQNSQLTKEKCSVCVCLVESIYYSFVVIAFVIVLTLMIFHAHSFSQSQFEVFASNEVDIGNNDTAVTVDDYTDYDFDGY